MAELRTCDVGATLSPLDVGSWNCYGDRSCKSSDTAK